MNVGNGAQPRAAAATAPVDERFDFPGVDLGSQCDLVMKGGVTSGVVYPGAVLELAKKYRFRSIGGASAGAIAAAVTAAAEFARERGGFDRLEALRREIRQEGFLRSLFQPQANLRSLFEFCLALGEEFGAKPNAGKGKARTGWQGLKATYAHAEQCFERRSALALGGAFSGLCIAVVVQLPWMLAFFGLSSGVSLWLVAFAAAISVGLMRLGAGIGRAVAVGQAAFAQLRFWADRHQSGFGLCRGSRGVEQAPGEREALTDWLNLRINELAGKAGTDPPLTFEDLRGKRAGDGTNLGIVFQLVAVNLSQEQPYLFPFPKRIFVFAEADMAKLFPPPVVEYLCDWGRTNPFSKVCLPDGYYVLPAGEYLPVIVATRLSLSFPGLLSAVRLYSVKPRCFGKGSRTRPYAIQLDDLEENWFSDGGIASNFPIHMFDAWFPMRPTFGISLSDQTFASQNRVGLSSFETVSAPPDEAEADPADEAAPASDPDIFMPHPRDETRMRAKIKPILGVSDFASAIFGTAQNFRDTIQSTLPSYRERIVHISLSADQGGLNLNMTPAVIAAIEKKGVRAGQLITSSFDFSQHQWVRSLVLFDKLETELLRMTANRTGNELRAGYHWLLEEQLKRTVDRWYKPQGDAWCKEAADRAEVLFHWLNDWSERSQGEPFFSDAPPRPDSILRITPTV